MVSEESKAIIQEALDKLAGLEGSTLEYMEALDLGKQMFNTAILLCTKDIQPGARGPLKHEVVDIMDQKGRDGIIRKE